MQLTTEQKVQGRANFFGSSEIAWQADLNINLQNPDRYEWESSEPEWKAES